MAIMAIRINRWIGRLSRVTSGGNFIPEIDGLRFLAIGSVLLFHVNYSLGRAYHWTMKPWEQTISNALSRGTLGVELFFVISGFILALPFARHYLYGGKAVDIRRYYLRRVTRLEPPYILTLILFYAASWYMGDVDMSGHYLSTFLVRLFYLHGLVYAEAPALNGVTWSLEIEVQFYLLMPLLAQVFRLPRAIRRGGLAVAVALLPFLRLQGRMDFTVLSQLGLFLAGFLFADIYLEMRENKAVGKTRYDWAAVVLFVTAVGWPWPDPIALWTLRHILPSVILIFLYLMFRGRWLRRFFSWKPVYIIGGMCYSIYLIHYPFMALFGRVLARKLPNLAYLPALAIGVLVWVPVILAISTVFFVLIEHPCMDHAWPQKLQARIRRPSVAGAGPGRPPAGVATEGQAERRDSEKG